MKTSLVIPTTPNHFHYLKCILDCYTKQTIIPNEVVISISNSHTMDNNNIIEIKKIFSDKFESLILLEHKETVFEGPNRGKGSEVCTGDIITYHDSDDVPHPQRIEIIKYFFENFDILHLNHSYTYEKKFDILTEFNTIEYKNSETMYEKYFKNNTWSRPRIVYDENGNSLPYGSGFGWKICGGPTSIKKEVLDKINWNRERDISYDYDFCMDTLFNFNKSMIINIPLIWYNKEGSLDWICK